VGRALSSLALGGVGAREGGQSVGSRYRLGVSDDRIEGEILDAITEGGSCATCGTPWASVVKIDGNRPVKVKGGYPNDVCVLGTGESRPLARNRLLA